MIFLPRYKLHLLASDGKWEDYTTVTVNVVNKNDEAPVFTVNEYYGSVTEELDGSPVFVLQVRSNSFVHCEQITKYTPQLQTSEDPSLYTTEGSSEYIHYTPLNTQCKQLSL